eukprot:CAMPEP_0201517336 /NCGR_PEP_ID=MMETSP0161_2-20130828/8468_1 /ASSEMBLY_ACC=CAM_ASM_000251 /TAXON_ID=180227 /ORGANISM="Neoparamoeba aestuarina, Strain SoJaBio B1-5/56/2" /LENGTH=106 /DNA_ID=CAMNT_0047914797 /DNA_START=71 /DNA_END=388 /DNA_ORIENTATION=+
MAENYLDKTTSTTTTIEEEKVALYCVSVLFSEGEKEREKEGEKEREGVRERIVGLAEKIVVGWERVKEKETDKEKEKEAFNAFLFFSQYYGFFCRKWCSSQRVAFF